MTYFLERQPELIAVPIVGIVYMGLLYIFVVTTFFLASFVDPGIYPRGQCVCVCVCVGGGGGGDEWWLCWSLVLTVFGCGCYFLSILFCAFYSFVSYVSLVLVGVVLVTYLFPY